MYNFEIIVTPSAQEDMKNIFDYIYVDNRKKAVEIIDEFEKGFEELSLFPFSGTVKYGFVVRDVRQYIVAKHYQIIYHVKNDTIFILRVLTGYQDLFAK